MNENSRFSFHSHSPDQTARCAQALARVCVPALGAGGAFVVNLVGELGAGKTHFVKGLASGLGLEAESVTSPTFAIVNEYGAHAGAGLVHLDFYRLESEAALEEVGFLDLLALPAMLAIEWGDRFPRSLPIDHLTVEISRQVAIADASASGVIDPGLEGAVDSADDATLELRPRHLVVRASGAQSQKTLEAWRASLRDNNLTQTTDGDSPSKGR